MEFFYQDTITVPLPPLDPDADPDRWFLRNISFGKPMINWTRPALTNRTVQASGPLFTGAKNGQAAAAAEERQAWMYASQGVLYYAFPIEIVCGIVGGAVSLATIARQKKTSNDSYLIGFSLAAVLLLACGGTMKLQDYVPHSNAYQAMYGYVKSANDWLWYSALWILVVMALERGLTLVQNQKKAFCSSVQSSIVVVMIFSVCLVSALPEFWEYEAVETFDYVSNQTIVVSHVSPTADSPEYRIMYFWYSVTITVFLPYPILAVMTIVLAQSMRRARHARRRLLHRKRTILSRKLSDDVHLTRLYIVMVLLYIVLSAPLTFLIIVNGITPYWSWPADNLYSALYLIFEFVFYFYFSIQLPLYLSYYDKFRHSFVRLFCCCCCCAGYRDKRQAEALRQETKDDFIYKR